MSSSSRTKHPTLSVPQTGPALRTSRYYATLTVIALGVVGVSFALLRHIQPLRLSISTKPLSDLMIAADGQSLALVVGVIATTVAVLVLPYLFQDLRETVNELADSGDLPVRNAVGQDLIGYGLAALGVLVATPQTALAVAGCATALRLAFFAASARIALYDHFVLRGTRLACVVIGLAVGLATSVSVEALVVVCIGIGSGTGLLGMINARSCRRRSSRRRTNISRTNING